MLQNPFLFPLSLAALGLGAVGQPVLAQGRGYPELSRESELRLAMSAGPLTVSSKADVYLMGAKGFEKAVDGSNGWACLVVRSATEKGQLAPHCLNPQAEATVLPSLLLEGALQARGLDGKAIESEMQARWRDGRLPMPSGPAYAYMLSKGQRLGANGGSFKPHFMLYMPYASNASIGGDPRRQQFPFVGPYQNHPLATVVIIMEEFVDPADVELPAK
ncbi:MAG: hypothetical protein AB7R55_09780 [Gemmatimonadales bacterium]